MATEIAAAVANSVVESLLVRVKKELKFWASSSDYVKDMHKKMSVLVGAATDMETRHVANKRERKMVPTRVTGWLEEVENIKVRADGVPTQGAGCSNIKTRYREGKQAFDIVKDIDSLIKEKDEMLWTDYITPLGMVSPPRSSSSVEVHEVKQNKNNLKSRVLIFNDSLKCLEADNINTQMMALYGMGGVGKTTMMKDLEEAARDKYIFKYIVKVEVGQNPNLLAVQKEVAKFIKDGALTEKDTDVSAESLRKRFKKIFEEDKMKVLVILDNVWEVFNLNHIGLTSPLPNGFKLLLTSREESVCRQMGVEASSMFKMTPLEEPEGKKLFWETTGLGSVCNIQADLYKIGEEIIKRCGGLPLAITAIASALGDDKEKDEWADALSRLNNTSVDDYNIREVFKISYENLKEDDLKAIFLLSGLFPEANNINKEDLLWYGWGLKFFRNVATIAEGRRRVNTCVNKLIRSNLLIKGDQEGIVKIHDLVRDFVLSNFTDVKQASINLEELNEEESYDRILLKCEDTSDFPVDLNHPNLTLLMVMGENKQLKFREDNFSRMQKLKVVAYEKVVGLLLPRHSTNLRTLSIRSCRLVENDISFLGDLVNLEVLSIADCEINKLPSEIEKLKRLKLLNVTGHSGDLCIDVCVLQSLERLKELYLGDITFTNANFEALKMLSSKLSALGVGFSRNKEEAKYMCFEKLERFMVSIGCQTILDVDYGAYDAYYAYYASVDSCKNTLSLVISKSELIEYKINKLFSKTEILILEVSDMNHLEDILAHPPQNSFCNLKALDAFNCTSLTYLFTISVAKGLTELETLKIRCCPVLKSLINCEKSEVEVIEFRKLKILYMVDLPELVSLCDPIDIVIDLPQLLELYICNIDKFTSIFHGNNINTSAKLLCMNTELVMPKLEKLKVHCMQNLKEIWSCEITSHGAEVDYISMLKRIEVGKCDSLVNLFPSNPMRLLGHLEELTITNCSSIEVLFNIDLGRIEQLTSNSSLTSITVDYSKNLREVFRIKDHVNSNYSAGLLIPGFEAIQHIQIYLCERFRNIVTPTTANFDMRALKDIDISFCEGYEPVKNSQEERTTISSSEEEISQVGALISIVVLPSSYETTLNFHNLRKVEIYRNNGLEVVFEIESRSNYRDQSVTTQQQNPPPLTLLPYLEHVKLDDMEKMSHVWKCTNWNEFFILHKNQPRLSSFQNLKTIHLSWCNSIKFLFSPLMVKLLSNLEEIDISFCESIEEVVSSVDEEMITSASAHSTTTTLFPRLYSLELFDLNNLKHIGPDGFRMKFPNLKILKIVHCPRLENVFTISTIKSLKKLETLMIGRCKALKVIVKQEYEEHTTEEHLIFPHLKSIELFDLPNLESFLLGMNIDFQLPLLKNVKIDDCPKLMVFTSGRLTTPTLKYIHTELGKYKYNPEHGLNFYVTSRLHQTPSTISEGGPFSLHNCVEMKKQCIYRSTLILSNEFLQLQELEMITAKDCDNAEEVFEVALEVSNSMSHTVVNLPKLREVNLGYLQSLKYIWKSNQWRIFEFPNLTRLYIKSCNSLEHVFTYSMVTCVMQLQELHVEYCTKMKVIVKEDEDWDTTSNEIKFPCLKSLKLEYLESLEGFCLGEEDFTLPSLDTLEIEKCEKISVFTKGRSVTPKLRVVKTSDDSFDVGEDINTFIVTYKQEEFQF